MHILHILLNVYGGDYNITPFIGPRGASASQNRTKPRRQQLRARTPLGSGLSRSYKPPLTFGDVFLRRAAGMAALSCQRPSVNWPPFSNVVQQFAIRNGSTDDSQVGNGLG